MRRLFLDDFRIPTDCIHYMNKRIGAENVIYLEKWHVVINYDEFVEYIQEHGVPDIISFDHDLADEHYSPTMYDINGSYDEISNSFKEKTGADCAKWLCEYCMENNKQLPKYYVHSMNPIGAANIDGILKNCQKFLNFNDK